LAFSLALASEQINGIKRIRMKNVKCRHTFIDSIFNPEIDLE
jgi:hypothetical protein